MTDAFSLDISAGFPLLVPEIFKGYSDVSACFTTRHGGISSTPMDTMNLGLNQNDTFENLSENYRRLTVYFGRDVGKLRLSCQVHSDQIIQVDDIFPPAGICIERNFEADALITDRPGQILITHHADCTPVFLFDPINKCIGLVHSGWRGTALGIAKKTVNKMSDRFGSRPENLLCAIGPRIGQCCFETDGDVPEQMIRSMPELPPSSVIAGASGKYHVDLGAVIEHQLISAGIKRINISISGFCTCCRDDLFFSHRRMGKMRGTMAAAMMLC